jgi:hypothetical protein
MSGWFTAYLTQPRSVFSRQLDLDLENECQILRGKGAYIL